MFQVEAMVVVQAQINVALRRETATMIQNALGILSADITIVTQL